MIQKNFELNNCSKRFFIQVFHCDEEDRTSKEIIITKELEEILDQMPKLSPEFMILCEQLKGKLGEFLSFFYEMPKPADIGEENKYETKKNVTRVK